MDGYRVSEEDKTAIRAIFDLTDDDLGVLVNSMKKWTKNNAQLPIESQDEDYLNIMLLRSKFQEDLTKKNIENYFKGLSKYPEVFKKLGKFKPSEEVGVAVASRNLTPKFERIGILKVLPKNLTTKKFDINQMILAAVTTGIIMYNNDYVTSVRFILDFEGITIFHVFKLNLTDLFKLVSITENILRTRISGIELLNAPRIMTALLGIARMVLKPKLFSRVEVLREWTLSRSDLPVESQDEIFLNVMLLRSRFRQEIAKRLIEKYFEYLSDYPEIFQNLGKFKPSDEIGITVTVPKMTPNSERVVIMKLLPRNLAVKPFDMHQLLLIATTASILIYDYDYVDSVRCVLDLEGFTIMHTFKFNLIELYMKFGPIYQNMFRLKVAGVEIINVPTHVYVFLATVKTFLPEKLFSRITTHSDLSSLHKNIPLECLPSDYGGEAESTEELVEKWDHIIEAHQSFFEKVASLSQANDPNKDDET